MKGSPNVNTNAPILTDRVSRVIELLFMVPFEREGGGRSV